VENWEIEGFLGRLLDKQDRGAGRVELALEIVAWDRFCVAYKRPGSPAHKVWVLYDQFMKRFSTPRAKDIPVMIQELERIRDQQHKSWFVEDAIMLLRGYSFYRGTAFRQVFDSSGSPIGRWRFEGGDTPETRWWVSEKGMRRQTPPYYIPEPPV
jgi:hypothetical protein